MSYWNATYTHGKMFEGKQAMFSLLCDFSAEQSQTLVDCGRKLLCARMQSILTKSISDNLVQSIYSNLHPVSGKQGFDVTGLGGTGECTCDQSIKDVFTSFNKMSHFCQKNRSMFNHSFQEALLDLLQAEQNGY